MAFFSLIVFKPVFNFNYLQLTQVRKCLFNFKVRTDGTVQGTYLLVQNRDHRGEEDEQPHGKSLNEV